MNKAIKIVWLFISLTSIVGLSGCTTPGKKLLPHGDMTMAQIYRVQTGLAAPSDSKAHGDNAISSNQFDASSYQGRSNSVMPVGDKSTDDAPNPINSQINSEFKVLPNPNIAAYIFPHMAHYSGTNVPVPGYTTTFFLYEKNHYAMPGEEY